MTMNANADTEELETLTDEQVGDSEENLQESPPDAFEERVARLEATQQLTQRQVQQLNAAVGRAQSLADRFAKSGDPKVEEKVQAAMAEVYDVLGTVSDSIDPAILPESSKQRVTAAREAARVASQQRDIDARIEAAVAARTPIQTLDPVQLEAQAVAEITGLGLNPDDPAFNWGFAAQLLHGSADGVNQMWNYIRTQERSLVTNKPEANTETDGEGGPRRRPRTTPPSAGTGANRSSLDIFMDPNTPMDEKIKLGREAGLPF